MDWRLEPPEDKIIGYCENCSEPLYGCEEYEEVCSRDCAIELYGIKRVVNERRCVLCDEPLDEFMGYLEDADGEQYCSLECAMEFLKHCGLRG